MNYSKYLIYYIFIVSIFQNNLLWADTDIFPVKNFNKKNYSAGNQNWSVDAAPNGFVYFANHEGLLEFDGVSWTLHKLPNETILRSVLVASDSLIFTGGYRELGYWKRDRWNNLTYFSLNKLAERYFSSNEEFWNIALHGDTVFFHSFGTILMYQNNSVTQLELPGFASTMNRCHNKVLVGIRERGIYSIKDEKLMPYITDPRLHNAILRFIIPYKNNGLLIGTASNGIFEWNGNSLQEWNAGWTDYFIKNDLNRAHTNKKGQLILGTIANGIVVFDENNHLIASYQTSNGLQNNTILGIDSDIFGNTWLALNSGIDFISSQSSRGIKIENIPGIGSIYDAAIFENKIYLGTNRGLYYKQLEEENSNYTLINEAQGQVWHCDVIDGTLIVGFNEGVIGIKNGKAQVISNQPGGFSIRRDPFHPEEIFIEATYSNLVVLENTGGVFKQKETIKGFLDLIRYIEFDHTGNLWASHMRRGIYKLQLNTARDSVIESKYYGENSVFGKDHSLHVFKIENRIVFTTEKLIYTYDDLNDTIIPFEKLNQQLGEFSKAHRIIKGPHSHYWFISKEKIGLFSIFNDEVKLLKTIPKELFSSNEIIDVYENIYPVSSTESILCMENGIAYINTEEANINPMIHRFAPKLRKINLTDNQGNHGEYTFENDLLQIKYRYNNIAIHYSFPHYTHAPIKFQSQMAGLNPEWSDKKDKPVFNFDRLPEGEYELIVKAIDPWGNESGVDHLKIEVLPPWYLSNYAQSGYILIFVSIIIGLQFWGIRRTRKKERRQLELREQELIKVRNEKLRNEIKHKSKELANSTMSIIKKNEFLLKLKDTLSNQKNQLGTRYPDKYYYHLLRKIDENISSQEDWHLFEINFERAHEQFLQKIKEQYPELTSKDLRLCAFLRMNLTSKEIAPLMGISVRGVENHRYRLRKKMGLEHDDSLVDMILKM